MARIIIEALRIGPEKNFCYLILCPKTGSAALIDAAFEFDRVIKWAQSFTPQLSVPVKVEYLLVTHGHWDHSGGVPDMLARCPHAKVVANENEQIRLKKAGIAVDIALKDQETFQVGEISVQGLHTPGHTEGGCCYLTDSQVFSGDTLFIGQCGRTDLPGGSDAELYVSLQKLKTLPRETVVRPGHDYGPTPVSTIGFELENNPTMKAQTLEEFMALP